MLTEAGLVEWLVRQVPRDEPAFVVLLGVLVPGAGGGRPTALFETAAWSLEEAEAVALAAACEVVGLPGSPAHERTPSMCSWRDGPPDVGDAGRRCPVEVVAPAGGLLDAPGTDVDPLERWPGILAAAVAAGVLTPSQVVIVARSRMEQRPLAEIARALGRPYDAVRKERRRAETALRTFALGYVSEGW